MEILLLKRFLKSLQEYPSMSFSYIGKIGDALGSIIRFPKNFLFGLVWSAVMWVLLILIAMLALIPLLPSLALSASTDPSSMSNIDITPFAIFYLMTFAIFMILKPIGDISSLAYANASIEEKNLGFFEFMGYLKARFLSLLLANLISIFVGIFGVILIVLISSTALSLIMPLSSDQLLQEILSFVLVALPLLLLFALVSLFVPFAFVNDMNKIRKGVFESSIHCIKLSLSKLTVIFPISVLIFAWNYLVLNLMGIPFCIAVIFLGMALSFLGWYVFNYVFILLLDENSAKLSEKEAKKPKRK
jgi:hypothetical protein